MNLHSPEAVGLAAGTLTTIAFVPQLVQIVRTRSADDVSWAMFGIFVAGVAMWLWYGVLTGAAPVILTNVVTLGLAAAIMLLKWSYGRAGADDPGPPRAGDADRQGKE